MNIDYIADYQEQHRIGEVAHANGLYNVLQRQINYFRKEYVEQPKFRDTIGILCENLEYKMNGELHE